MGNKKEKDMLRETRTENGLVRGLPAANNRITVYKGIPFAAPPVGENRWRAPQPAKDWEGVRECYKFAPISVQDTPGLGTDIYCREWHVDPEVDMGEDCLYLNIWTPAKTTNDRLPVLIWYFGGGFQWGYPNEMEFDGEHLAKEGVIVVSVNYRLGALGFLTHPSLKENQPEGYANFGNLDQQAGLKWVRRNIEFFGGDPNRITISGQSAGGSSTLTQLTCPDNYEDIAGAVILSGMIRDPFIKDTIIRPMALKDAQKNGEEFLEYLGVSSIDEARKLDAFFIKEKYASFRETHLMMSTIIDETFIKEDPYDAFMNGHRANVPVISGNTADEFKSGIPAKNKDEFVAKVKEVFKDKADQLLKYPEICTQYGDHYGNISVIESSVKSAFIKDANRPDSKPCYYYRFNPDIPGYDNPGTFHSVDLWFFFNNLDKCWRPMKGRHFDLARQMSSYWVNFIKTGDPNGIDSSLEQLPCWKPYSKDDRNEMEFTSDGAKAKVDNSDFIDFLTRFNANMLGTVNPYLPSWEYVPDGEPYVFGDRVYIYGSHDKFKGEIFCPGDYVCWSAPVDDLGAWRYEGVIYKATDDPRNKDRIMVLYAPDITVGPDGRYYLYYVLDKLNVVSVAVSDSPSGKFSFYGYVHYEDGTLLGEKEGDEPQFDPGVLTEGDNTYLYTGFCGQTDASRHGAMLTVLSKDMLTIKEAPKIVVPGKVYSEGTGFENHAFFEASSIRKHNDTYYFVYSSEVMHELCYATAKSPYGPFTYGGVIISNADIGIDSYKKADTPAGFGANNHGSIVDIGDEWYIFYHRHTNKTWYSGQGCAEKIKFLEDGSIPQVEMTSSGMGGEPLSDQNEYSAHIVCNMMVEDEPNMYVGGASQPFVTQDGADGDVCSAYISNIGYGATLGFKYFDFKDVKGIYVKTRGYSYGRFEIRTSLDGDVLGTVKLSSANDWRCFEGPFTPLNGISSLYLRYTGNDKCSIASFGFIH